MKKFRKFIFFAVIALASIFIVSCNDKDKEDQIELDSVKELLSVGFKNEGDTINSVTGDLILEKTFGNATITWSSSNTAVVSNDGKVVSQDEVARVELTATIKVNKLTDTKKFNLTVLGRVVENYRVSFNAAGGSPTPEQQSVRSGLLADKPSEEPQKDRYSFAGWYLEDATEEYNFNEPVIDHVSLIARWELVEPLVRFNLGYQDAPHIDEQRLTLGAKVNKPVDPIRERYTFNGWFVDGEAFDFETNVNEDLILNAQWIQNKALVTFDNGFDLENPEDQIIDINTKANKPADPVRDRFEFLGWVIEGEEDLFDFDTEVEKDLHLIAKWKQLIAIVTFDTNGGTPEIEDKTITIGEILAEPAEPVKAQYDFAGWFSGNELYDFNSPVEKDLNLVANWVDSDEEISATIVGPDAITYYIGMPPFNPLQNMKAIDNEKELEYDLFVSAPSYTVLVPGTYYYRVAVAANPSIEKQIKLTVKPRVQIANDITSDVEITLWHSNGTAIENKLKQYATEFETMMLNKGYNIKVNIVKNGATYDELRSNVINAIKGAELPNLVQNYPDHVVEYDNNGVIESLTPYIFHSKHGLDPNNPNERLEDIIPAYLEENRSNNLNGDYLSFPFSKSTEVAVYNKTFFDAVLQGRAMPETWQGLFALKDDILAIKDEQIDAIATKWAASGKALTAQEIQKAKDEFVPFSYDSTSNAFITLTRQFGGEYTARNPQTGQGQVRFVNDQTKRMLNYFAEDRGRTFTVPQFWNAEYSNAVSLHGTTIFSVGSTGGLRYNLPVNSGYKLYEVGVMPVPYDMHNPSSRTAIQQGTNISLTKTGSQEEKLASWLFLKYLTSTDVQADYGSTIGYSPVRRSSYETPLFLNYLAKADLEIGSDYQEMGLSISNYKSLFEEKLISMGARAAAIQTEFMFYDDAFIGSSKAREEVGNAFERVILSGPGVNLADVIEASLQAAKEETERVIP